MAQLKTLLTDKSQFVREAKEKAIFILSLILGNDKEAAEYLLLSLLSRVHKRETGLILGNIPLNVSNVTPKQASLLGKFLSQVCALFVSFKSTLDSLTKSKFGSRKNIDTNLFENGILCIPSETVFFMDETELKEGKMAENAVANINAFAQLIENQVIIYDFTFQQQEIPIKVPVVIASTSRTLFKNSLHYPVRPSATPEQMEQNFAKVEQILNEDKENID